MSKLTLLIPHEENIITKVFLYRKVMGAPYFSTRDLELAQMIKAQGQDIF